VNLVFDWCYIIICVYVRTISGDTPIEAQVLYTSPGKDQY